MKGLPKNSKLIFKGIVGSHSYGLDTETSDVDYKGVYIQSNEDFLSDRYVEFVQISPDECYFELRKFLQLVSVANPNALEMLYLPENCIVSIEPEFMFLMIKRDCFLTKRCSKTFSGYANTQLRKSKGLTKKLNWEKLRTERKNVLDFCKVLGRSVGRVHNLKQWLKDLEIDQLNIGLTSIEGFRDTYKLYIGDYRGIIKDDFTNEPRVSIVPKELSDSWIGTLYWNREDYSVHCKDYKEYQKWIQERDTNRYVTNKKHGQTLDGKNILHTVRLIMTAEYIAKNGTLDIDMSENRDFLLRIKKGDVNLQQVTDEWSDRAEKIDELFLKSNLPDELPENYINELELKIRQL